MRLRQVLFSILKDFLIARIQMREILCKKIITSFLEVEKS